ncbi:hypothetical protein GWK47_050107 [Chionoecetes opilio]|uniref:Uncharacterized protein n=1 Tax=Chionoecetes opilio TaxID=41210 RepID=A0A8J5CTW4_CHIOP|nr:hypothetical protein GWK47_050107 [Chionoecetes opilio]
MHDPNSRHCCIGDTRGPLHPGGWTGPLNSTTTSSGTLYLPTVRHNTTHPTASSNFHMPGCPSPNWQYGGWPASPAVPVPPATPRKPVRSKGDSAESVGKVLGSSIAEDGTYPHTLQD